MNNNDTYKVAQWLDSCQTRFKNMKSAGLDDNGYPAITKALTNFDERGYLTVGEVTYLFDRTDTRGALPKYNTHRGYNKLHGDMLPCPLKELIATNIVNWRTGQNGVMTQPLANAIRADSNWEWRTGNLRPQQNTTFSDLFD